jgi:hypothetical protein
METVRFAGFRTHRGQTVKGTLQMINFHSVFSKDAASPAAPPEDNSRNWRSELGTFWRDIEEAGSVAKAIRLRSPAESERNEKGGTSGPPDGEDAVRTSRWAHLRTLCAGIL